MPGRRQRPSACCFTRAACTALAKCTKARRRWIGWRRSRNAASRSRRRRPRACGKTSRSTSSTPLATWTSRPRWSARCACWTARWRCLTRCTAWSRSRRRCGGRPTSTRCPAFASLTRWTRWAPISITPSTPSASAWRPSRCRSRCRLGRRKSSRAASTCST